MKALWLFLCLSLTSFPVHSQVLSTFGNTAANGGSWNYNPTTSTVSGTEGFGDFLYGTPLTLNISGSTQIRLVASVATAPTGSFDIALEDNVGNTATASFLWSSFTPGPTVETASLSYGAFNFSNIASWRLVSGGSLQPVNASFSNFSAVADATASPEPSTYLLTFVGLSLIYVLHRRKRTIEGCGGERASRLR